MKNRYEVRGNEVEFTIKRRNGVIVPTIIDRDDLDRVLERYKYLFSRFDTKSKKYYIYGVVRNTSPIVKEPLHRFIMNAPAGKVVDHINRQPTDNRKENLRVVTQGQNVQNVDAYSRNRSGIRGVTWHKVTGKWQVNVQVNERNYYLGLFEDKYEARRVASEFRAKHMPFSEDALRRRSS